MLGKGAEVKQEPALSLWVELTDSNIRRYGCSKLEIKLSHLGRGTDERNFIAGVYSMSKYTPARRCSAGYFQGTSRPQE